MLRLGVSGCGRMSSDLARHAVKLGRASIVAIYDTDVATLRQRCEEFGAEPMVSLEELAARAEIDAYLVGSPPLHHHENVLALSASGRPIYCEKPLCTTVASCDEMIDACRSSGAKLFVGQVLRLFPLFWRSHEIIETGELGAPKLISVTRSGRSKVFDEGWRKSFAETGGLLLEVNSHELDYMGSLMGRAEWVFARAANINGWGDFDDSLFVQIGYQDGGLGMLHSSNASPIGEYRVHIQCERGCLLHSGFGGELKYRSFDADQATSITASELADLPDPYDRELTSFFDWAEYDTPPLFTGETGRTNVAVAEAAYRSIRSGTPEPVTP